MITGEKLKVFLLCFIGLCWTVNHQAEWMMCSCAISGTSDPTKNCPENSLATADDWVNLWLASWVQRKDLICTHPKQSDRNTSGLGWGRSYAQLYNFFLLNVSNCHSFCWTPGSVFSGYSTRPPSFCLSFYHHFTYLHQSCQIGEAFAFFLVLPVVTITCSLNVVGFRFDSLVSGFMLRSLNFVLPVTTKGFQMKLRPAADHSSFLHPFFSCLECFI